MILFDMIGFVDCVWKLKRWNDPYPIELRSIFVYRIPFWAVWSSSTGGCPKRKNSDLRIGNLDKVMRPLSVH